MLLQMPVSEWPAVPKFPFPIEEGERSRLQEQTAALDVPTSSASRAASSSSACTASASLAATVAVSSGGIFALPAEVLTRITARMLGCAQPAGALAACCQGSSTLFRDSSGRLRVGGIVTASLRSAILGCTRASCEDLEVLRVDLNSESRENLHREEIDLLIRLLSALLINAERLRVLSVRLASFDAKMERLRLSRNAWDALVHGLGALAHHRRLKTLELSSVAIKASQATQVMGCRSTSMAAPLEKKVAGYSEEFDGASAAAPLTFLEALRNLSMLEELALTHGEIFGATGKLLNKIICEMKMLQRVDLTRNHIPKQVMQELRSLLPAHVELNGEDQQTFFFY